MLPQGSEWTLHQGIHIYDGYFKLKEQGSAVTSLTPTADHLHFYAKDKSAVTELFYKNSSGVERDLSLVASAMQGIGSTVSGGTTGSVLFVGSGPVLAQDNANFFWDDTNNRLALGVGVASITPVSVLEVFETGVSSPRHLTISHTGANVPGAALFLRKSEGTRASPAALGPGRELGEIDWQGFGTSFVTAAQIKVVAPSAFSATAAATRMLFSTTPAASVTLTERMRLLEDGDLIIGHTAHPNSTLVGRGLVVVRSSASLPAEVVASSHGFAGQSQFRGISTRGTATSPSATQTDDGVTVSLMGFGATAYSTGRAFVALRANQNWTDTAQGTHVALFTTPDGSTTSAERLRIEASGDVSHASGVKHRMLSQNRFRHLNALAVATHNTAQTGLTVNTWNTVAFGAEDLDTDTLHSTASNTSRLTAQLTGKYLVGGSVYIDETNIGTPVNAGVRMIKNGGTATIYGNNTSETSATFFDPTLSVSVLVDLVATDYMEIQALGSGSSGTFDLPVLAGLTRFWMLYVGE